MKINRSILPKDKNIILEEDLDFSTCTYDEHHVRNIKKCHIQADIQDYDDILKVKIKGEADVVASCSYTLDDVDLKIKIDEQLFFSHEEKDDINIEYEPRNIFDLDPYVLALIIASVPHNIVKEGASLPSSGQGYRVIKEEDYLKEKQNDKNHQFDILDNIDLPDNDLD